MVAAGAMSRLGAVVAVLMRIERETWALLGGLWSGDVGTRGEGGEWVMGGDMGG